MRISPAILSRYIDLPEGAEALRDLLDDCGLEVKRVEDDGVMVLELLANRGDHHCYEGVARELSGRTGAALRLPEVATLEEGPSPWPLRCETPDCPVYTATLLERVGEPFGEPAPLGADALATLAAAGIHSLSPPIDATNLSNLELGQPTHAFDADTLVGAITVRPSRPGETCWPLFRPEPVTLPEGTLVIADEVRVLAVAGVIGCEESKTTPATRRVLLESACFDAVKVRLAARALGISTDSSTRFERGADPSRPLMGAGRVVHLLESTGAWRRAGPTGVVGDWVDPGLRLRLSAEAASRFLEHPLAPAEIAERLGRLGFTCAPLDGDALEVAVPPHRLPDVAFVADLYEELAKSLGYNHTPASLPPIDKGARPSEAELRRRQAEEVLLGQGFYEVFTDGFYGRDLIERLGLPEDHPLRAHVEVSNALDRGYSLLKNNALAQAVEAVAVNLRVRNDEVRAYEWTRTFHPRPQDPDAGHGRPGSPADEREVLWAVASGTDRPRTWAGGARPADVFFLKGLLAELAVELGLDLQLDPGAGDHPLACCLHPGRAARVRLNGRVVGALGEVHPRLLRAFKIKGQRPVYLELDAEALLGEGRRPAYVEPPALHPIERALAFLLPPGVEAGAVRAALLGASAAAHIDAVDITDLFIPEGQEGRAVTLTLRFANRVEAPLSSDEVNAVLRALAAEVLDRFGPRGVTQR